MRIMHGRQLTAVAVCIDNINRILFVLIMSLSYRRETFLQVNLKPTLTFYYYFYPLCLMHLAAANSSMEVQLYDFLTFLFQSKLLVFMLYSLLKKRDYDDSKVIADCGR